LEGLREYAGDALFYDFSHCKEFRESKEVKDLEVPSISDLYIVSVGTGKEKQKYDYRKAKDWGAVGWARPLIDILLSASAEVVDYQLRQLFAVAGCSDCYVRLEPELGKAKPDMDDALEENIAQLIDAGECFVKDNAEVLEGMVNQLLVIR
jgi:hypothetical protein